MMPSPLHSTSSSHTYTEEEEKKEKKKTLRQNAVHTLQFSIQYIYPNEAGWENEPTGNDNFPLHMDSGLSD